MASCGSLLEEAASYNNKNIKKKKTGHDAEEQLRSQTHVDVVARSGDAPAGTEGAAIESWGVGRIHSHTTLHADTT